GSAAVAALGVGDVVAEAAVGAEAGRGGGLLAAGERGGVPAGEQAAGDGFGVALDARELAGDEDAGMGLELERLGEQRGRVDIGVAVDLAVAQEAGVFEPGDEAKDAGLLAELEVVLE